MSAKEPTARRSGSPSVRCRLVFAGTKTCTMASSGIQWHPPWPRSRGLLQLRLAYGLTVLQLTLAYARLPSPRGRLTALVEHLMLGQREREKRDALQH